MSKRNHGEIVITYAEGHSGPSLPFSVKVLKTRPLMSIEDAEKYLRHEIEGDDDHDLVYYIVKVAKSFTVCTRRTLVTPHAGDA